MRIGIIGTGIAGLTAAHVLSRRHGVTVFEANRHAGGHTNTVPVREGSRVIPVDTGFIVFNEPNYPNLCRLFAELGVESRDSDMGFSVHCERTGIEYNGSSLQQVFAQRRNLLRPGHWRMLADIQRFNRDAPALLDDERNDLMTVADYVAKHGYGPDFTDRYLLPLGASLWSCPTDRFRAFPIRFVVEFLANHRMLQVEGRPVWKTVKGGSWEYVKRLTDPLRENIHLGVAAAAVRRGSNGVEVTLADGRSQRFDEVVIASHADQALALVSNPETEERDILRCFPYQTNEAVLHTDPSLLPRRRTAWASWNYRIPRAERGAVTISYNMNMLQGLDTKETYCVSLNPGSLLDSTRVIRRIRYEHPLFTADRGAAQARHPELTRRRGISYCGAYWGYGFHEDGVSSALAVCAAFELELGRAA